MQRNTIVSFAILGTSLLSAYAVVPGLIDVATGADCQRLCRTFRAAVANVDPPNLPYGTYCLDFHNHDRGGLVYGTGPGDPDIFGQINDDCDVHDVLDCPTTCTEYNPRIVNFVLPNLDILDEMKVKRTSCIDESMVP